MVLFGVVAALTLACGSKKPDAVAPPDPTTVATPVTPAPTPAVDPVRPATPPVPDAGPAIAADVPPEVFPPVFTKVGVGQPVSFSVAAIDQNLEETRVDVTAMPKSATFDALTQTVTWKPTKADQPKAAFTLQITQPVLAGRGDSAPKVATKTWTFEVTAKKQPMPVASVQTPIIETVLMIRQPKRLEQVNKEWPLDRMLLVGAEGFKWQFSEENRAKLSGTHDKPALFESFLTGLAQTHANPRLDPKSDKFDKVAFGDPAAWKIVAVRPRIDRAWTEMRIVYRAVKAPEPTFAMFRIRPTVELVPPLPRPPEERVHNNKTFLGMVAKHLLPGGAPSDKLMKDQLAHGKAVAALVNELMAFDAKDPAKRYARTFVIGIATEAQLGGGSARNPDGSYKHGDAWAWSAMKPFQTEDGKAQRWVNVRIPGFWTMTAPSDDGKTWVPKCAPKYTAGAPGHVAGYEALCRKTLGFVDLPATENGKVIGSKIDSNHLFADHKLRDMVKLLPLDDGRRDLGEENGMTCSQCHIRNFGMHDYADPANVDPSAGVPKTRNKKLATLNFQIVPSTHWEEFTINFLHHQECRGKTHLEQYLGPEAAKGLTCPLAPPPPSK